MKTPIKFRNIAILLVLILGTMNMKAISQEREVNQSQNQKFHSNKHCKSLPNITEDQSAKIKDLRTEHLKKMTQYKNQLQEKNAHHQTLMTADSPDMKSINKNIDEISSINNKILKEKANHLQSVRKLLTNEQRVAFDQKSHSHNRANSQKRHGKGQCHEKGENNFINK